MDAPVVSADKADFLLSCLPASGGSRAEWMFRLNLDKKIRLKQKSKNKKVRSQMNGVSTNKCRWRMP